MSWLPQQSVEWLYEQSGGYRFSRWVPATIVKIGNTYAVIDAKLRSGGTKRIRVKLNRLRPAAAEANR